MTVKTLDWVLRHHKVEIVYCYSAGEFLQQRHRFVDGLAEIGFYLILVVYGEGHLVAYQLVKFSILRA